MTSRRKAHLDLLERRLTGPRKIALFGHRAVGKTTLLAMFYREASAGRVPGLRLAAAKPATAEYLADKIARLESGEPPAATLGESELHLRLHHDGARFDLIVKDYQGEHVDLGSDAEIREFFADCDAVLLCLDPEATLDPNARRRRQQEIEELLERYIDNAGDGTAGRPIALVVTKYDRVVAAGGPPPGRVDEYVAAQYGMTRHALRTHAPSGAIFAVSAFGHAEADGRPPAELEPMGLDGPLLWLAERLEAEDRERLDWLWDLAPDDLPRLQRCVRAYERRYPKSDRTQAFRKQLAALQRRRLRRNVVRLAGLMVFAAAGVAAYDFVGYRSALAYDRTGTAPTLVERRWRELLTWHPTLSYIWPGAGRSAQDHLKAATVRAAEYRIESGVVSPGAAPDLAKIKEESPELIKDVQRVEAARDRKRQDARWDEINAAELAKDGEPEARLEGLKAFLREYPWTPHRDEAVALRDRLVEEVADRKRRIEGRTVEALVRAARLPNADANETIRAARDFLDRHPDSPRRSEVESLLDDAVRRLDELDIAKARDYSRQYPHNFALRARRYQDYLKAHRNGGRFVSEATAALDRIAREHDVYDYRLAYDHLTAHPDDVAEVARQLRSYLSAHPQGHYVHDARGYLAWFDRVTAPNEYRVTLRRGEVEPTTGKYLSGGAPDLSVEVWVAGVKHGPSPVVRNSRDPIWEYTFPRPIRWKLGDPVVIRIFDNDWSKSPVFTLSSAKDDPLGIRLLSGETRPSKGGRTRVVFASDFRMPGLTKPGG